MPLDHEGFMRLAIDEAELARGTTGDNPWVGCVIVNARDEILAKGHTQGPGEDHAEIAAARSAKARGVSIEGATMYSTLEPVGIQARTGGTGRGARGHLRRGPERHSTGSRGASAPMIQLRTDASPGKIHARTDAFTDGLFVDQGGGGNVLQGRSGAVENDRFLGRDSTLLRAGYDFTEFRVDSFPSRRASLECVVQLADLGALLETVCHQFTRAQNVRFQLLLFWTVRADRGQERA